MDFESRREPIVQNRILKNFSVADFSCIRPFLQPFALKARVTLQEFRKPIEHLYFVETGMASLMTPFSGNMIDTAMVGHRGAVGASIALGAKVSMHQSIVVVAGSALRIRADDLHRMMTERPAIREGLLNYIHTLMIHSSQTAICSSRHDLQQRLACWLCTACDSFDGAVLPVTHDHLSLVLGVRRAGVTEALIRFEEDGLIRKSRGVIQVRESLALKERACGCYDIISNAYRGTGLTGVALADRDKNRQIHVSSRSP